MIYKPRFPPQNIGWRYILDDQRAMLTMIHRLRKLGKLALSPTCVSVNEYSPLEEWVHEDGRVVVIGDAAHPLPVRDSALWLM
jgi:2-polyprenyl-6-methoxyphenol hydroxylase-like FAD-dependent oxidoreductase